MAIRPTVVEIFQSGPKWPDWTDLQTDHGAMPLAWLKNVYKQNINDHEYNVQH